MKFKTIGLLAAACLAGSCITTCSRPRPKTEPKTTLSEKEKISTPETEAETAAQPEPEPQPAVPSSVLDPAFKEAMDSYEAFFAEYAEFIQAYKKDPTNLTLLAEYAQMMQQYETTMESLEKWESSDMNDAETAYYLEVHSRILQKLAAAGM